MNNMIIIKTSVTKIKLPTYNNRVKACTKVCTEESHPILTTDKVTKVTKDVTIVTNSLT